ncbi:stage III sporulation protein AF [Paenibacillus sp. GCM10028914]|uniref:stage III sporulation protein AF n=1 Tax=Paenibacillus sp. GCM10028914 TaxID=3273416 RepID=UPI003614E9DA
MDWLSEWLKSVIMIVLFAAFVDLILPSKSMQRYARLVLSMLILLALLRPIISLLTVSPEKQFALELERVENGTNTPREAELDYILAQAEKLKNVQQSQSLQWAGEEVAKQMKDQITKETGEQVDEVKVILAAPSEATGSAVIKSVEVRLREAETPESSQKQSLAESKGIKPVDTIRVNVETNTDESKNKSKTEDSVEAGKRVEARAGPVIDLLSSRWDLLPDQIVIRSIESDMNTKL